LSGLDGRVPGDGGPLPEQARLGQTVTAAILVEEAADVLYLPAAAVDVRGDRGTVTVVGVLEEQSSSTGFTDANDIAVAPLTAVQRTLTGFGALSQILVQDTGSDAVDAVEAETSAVLDGLLRVEDGVSAPYQITNAAELLETQADTA
jgi:putative ABC transport system permease protein